MILLRCLTRIYIIRIWQKLFEMVKEQAKTIIITTHYIEEAHQAQTVRKNKLLKIQIN